MLKVYIYFMMLQGDYTAWYLTYAIEQVYRVYKVTLNVLKLIQPNHHAVHMITI